MKSDYEGSAIFGFGAGLYNVASGDPESPSCQFIRGIWINEK
jgi:hypothetical protein